jgi:hypothetical protein
MEGESKVEAGSARDVSAVSHAASARTTQTAQVAQMAKSSETMCWEQEFFMQPL